MKKLLLILLFLPFFAFSQSSSNLLRSTISNNGSSVKTINKGIVQQSIGQSSLVGLQYTSKYIIRQGFIQPTHLKSTLPISNDVELSVDIYPNPTTDRITLDFREAVTGEVLLSIYDYSGRLIIEESQEAQATLSYSLNSLAPGNYFIQVSGSNKAFVTQIAKQK
tara:strand:+ start:20 stop:514 length:495 start_codon:yes stop_codon:yes gene_type:complete